MSETSPAGIRALVKEATAFEAQQRAGIALGIPALVGNLAVASIRSLMRSKDLTWDQRTTSLAHWLQTGSGHVPACTHWGCAHPLFAKDVALRRTLYTTEHGCARLSTKPGVKPPPQLSALRPPWLGPRRPPSPGASSPTGWPTRSLCWRGILLIGSLQTDTLMAVSAERLSWMDHACTWLWDTLSPGPDGQWWRSRTRVSL